MKVAVLALAAAIFLMPVAAMAEPSDFDLLGIKFGMSGEEAIAIIQQKDSAYEISENTITHHKGITAFLPNPKNKYKTSDTIVVLFEDGAGVWFIGRSREYNDDEQQPLSLIKESIEKKYELTLAPESEGGNVYVAVFDQNGKPYDGFENIKQKCRPMTSFGWGKTFRGTGAIMGVPDKYTALDTCGVAVTVVLDKSSKDRDFLSSYSIALTNSKLLGDIQKAAIAADEKERQDRKDKLNKNAVAPDL